MSGTVQINKLKPMIKIPPIYGTTMSGTETIISKWLNGDRESAIKLLVACISVNSPETPNNTDRMAEDTIKAWIDEHFEDK
jgi:hypothetical protein